MPSKSREEQQAQGLMRKLVNFILDNSVPVNLVFLLLMLVGVFALFHLPIERYPNVNMGKVVISTYFPGASPQDVEALVTREIEDALDDLESVEFVQSSSYRERSSIVVKFVDDTDYDRLYDELRLKVLGVMNELPASIDPPTFNVVDVANWLPAVAVNLTGDRSNRALTLMAEQMKIPLRQIPGVKEVDLEGEYVREFHVFLDPERLNKFGITFDEVAEALRRSNISVPAGTYSNENGEFVVVVDERYRTREQVAKTIIRRDGDGSYVTVGDVMTDARMSYRDPFVITSVNGKDCVILKLIKTRDGNAMDIVAAAQKIVENFKPTLAREGVGVVLSQDQRLTVRDSIRTLGLNLLCGILLVSIIIWVFMGLRNALLTTLGIPFSFLVTMVIMYFTGTSLNEITLFSFVLVSGIIVDDAIVVVENIYRHLQEGRPLRDSVVNGTAEVAFPVISATATTMAAFLPMLIMTGSTGEFFAEVPKAVTYALMASLFECLIVLAPHFMECPGWSKARSRALRHSGEQDRRFMRFLRKVNGKLVEQALRFRFSCLLLVLGAFVVALFLLGASIAGKASFIRIKFFPDEYTLYYVEAKGPLATSVETTSAKLKEITRAVLEGGPGQVLSATARAGYYLNEDYEAVFGSNLGHIIVEMPPKEDQKLPHNHGNDPLVHLDYMRKRLAPFAKKGWTIGIRPEKGGPPAGKDVNIRVVGSNPRSVQDLAADIHSFLRQDKRLGPYLIDLQDDQGQPNRTYRYHVRRERAAQYGLMPARVANLAGSVLDGRYVGKFRTVDEDVDLKLRLDPGSLDQPEAALDLPLVQHPSGPLRLGDLTRVACTLEPGQLNRYQNHRAISLMANIRPGAPLSSIMMVDAVRSHYQSVKQAYPGAELNFAGEFESTRRSYVSLTYAFAIAILLIYLILATQFHSYLQPLIILSAVVFSLIGVIFGKFVTQGLFTVNSFIATVGVTGVVVNDSLVLIDFINKSYREGRSRREAIKEGIRVRFRPILLTTLTTTLGLLPMALGFPEYSIVWGTMASTFVTGLCTATFLTLFIVPIEWDLLMGLRLRLQRGRAKRAEAIDA